MKKSFLISIVAIAALLLSSCGGGENGGSNSSPKNPFKSYISEFQKAVNMSKELEEKADNLKNMEDLGKLIAKAQEEETKYKETMKNLVAEDMDKEVDVAVAQDSPFAIEQPFTLGKTLIYTSSVWFEVKGALKCTTEIVIPDGKSSLGVNLNWIDAEGNTITSSKNFIVFKGEKNEAGEYIIPVDAVQEGKGFIIMNDNKFEEFKNGVSLEVSQK